MRLIIHRPVLDDSTESLHLHVDSRLSRPALAVKLNAGFHFIYRHVRDDSVMFLYTLTVSLPLMANREKHPSSRHVRNTTTNLDTDEPSSPKHKDGLVNTGPSITKDFFLSNTNALECPEFTSLQLGRMFALRSWLVFPASSPDVEDDVSAPRESCT